MHSQYVVLALIAATSAVPLNINLGAYSPALVVGDGEISLGSTESASQLMATLASGAAAGGGGGAEAAPKGQEGAQPASQPSGDKPATEQSQPAGGDPKKEGEGGGDDNKDKPAESKPAKRAPNLVRALESLLGKRAPAPAPADQQMAAVEAAMQWIKRDLAGFEAALGYAREAQKDQPKVELGTENAGVGILVNPGLNVPKDSAAAGDKPAAARRRKRAEVVTEESDAPKMTLVAITEV